MRIEATGCQCYEMQDARLDALGPCLGNAYDSKVNPNLRTP